LTRVQAFVVAGVVAAVILTGGLVYAFARTPSYSSAAAVVLAPRADLSPDDVPILVSSFGGSGTLGTYVQLIVSKETLRMAGSPAVIVEGREVPGSRVINVRAVGGPGAVRPALASVLRAARVAQRTLNDVWQLEVLQSPEPPVPTGPSRNVIIAASAVLAAFGAVFVLVALRRLGLLAEPLTSLGGRGSAAKRPAARPVRKKRDGARARHPVR
jgi:hypothetical protein